MAKQFDYDQPKREQTNRCAADECPRRPTSFGMSGSGLCRYHNGRAAKDWGFITHELRAHAEEIDWYERVLNWTVTDFEFDGKRMEPPTGLGRTEAMTLTEYRALLREYVNNLLHRTKKE